MKIPAVLEEKLKSDPALQTFTMAGVTAIEEWISGNPTTFFKEYTDHNVTHLEAVLNTVVDIALEESLQILTPRDVSVLVLAVCLHDSAMFLTEDGFQTLINGEGPWAAIAPFDKKPWPHLWEDFMATARRFDGRQLMSLFGDTDEVRRPPERSDHWNERDKKLIGEFIRRHHTRLAHEMANHGLPGAEGNAVGLLEPKDNRDFQHIADIAGLVARSHGHHLRDCLPYLKQNFNQRDFNGIHALYLMVLLRVADHLQVQRERANMHILKVRSLKSPYSRMEWRVHDCIHNITRETEDPEAIEIDARPDDVHVLLKVQAWLRSMQWELDSSWAVLGEIYGRSEALRELGLKLRRVRCNLDEDRLDQNSFDFVPKKLAFEADNADLLKLLVGPLYGNDPKIGIRELTQNAVDAVREIEDLFGQRPDLCQINRRNQQADIEITLHFNEHESLSEISISDRGIGMSLDVVQNYFLRAGASFRNSDAWRRQHEDENHNSRVVRSGRFGVGALAAFLLGDEITVTTRHVETPENQALTFHARIDDEALEVKQTSSAVGTIITVKLRDGVAEDFGFGHRQTLLEALDWLFEHWDYYWKNFIHYQAPNPTIQVNIIDNSLYAPENEKIPSENEEFKYPWRSFFSKKFPKIHWKHTYIFEKYSYRARSAGSIFCNGIYICKTQSRLEHNPLVLSRHINVPDLSIFDPNRQLQLNLQRSELTAGLSDIQADLDDSIMRDFIARALVCSPPNLDEPISRNWHFSRIPHLSESRYGEVGFSHMSTWAWSKEGFTFNYPNSLLAYPKERHLIAFVDGVTNELLSTVTDKKFPSNSWFSHIGRFDSSLNPKKALVRETLGADWRVIMRREDLEPSAAWLLIAAEVLDEVRRSNRLGKGIRELIDSADVIDRNNYWALICLDQSSKFKPSGYFMDLMNTSYDPSAKAYMEIVANPSNHLPELHEDELSELWLKYLGPDGLIPWSQEDRRSKFTKTFNDLEPYINHYLHELEHGMNARPSSSFMRNTDLGRQAEDNDWDDDL